LKENLKFSVTTESALLPFLLTCFCNKSRNYVKGILQRGQIAVDGRICRDYSLALYPGQRVEALLRPPLAGDKMSVPVIYEDDDMIAIDKPAGLLSISTDKERENTAYHIVSDYMKSHAKAGRVFIVHRLDRETSGVMLFAKNELTKRALQESWDELTARRGYIAVVEGEVLTPEGKITSWLKQTKTLLVYSSREQGDGKLAVTNYRTLQAGGKYSLLEISLDTGRKNQIRVHMSDMGHPVAGDKKYGAQTDPFGRLGLHASPLIIKHPHTGEQISLESITPGVFTAVGGVFPQKIRED
jgi:23S rRNA pseudouridine1911/1915/1917 synthase